jgi:hypothetical protein
MRAMTAWAPQLLTMSIVAMAQSPAGRSAVDRFRVKSPQVARSRSLRQPYQRSGYAVPAIVS